MMSKAKVAYCENCKAKVEVKTKARQVQQEIDGRAYVIKRREAVCPKCGHTIESRHSVEEADLKAKKTRARDESIVTPEQIALIPERYAIGKRPLSRLLGWGELTYTRLLEGSTPNKQHSDELRHLLEEPAAFARLLERGYHQGTITETAYRRSKHALDGLLTEEHQDSAKLFEVADRLCALAEGDLTPRALQVLVYLVQGRCIAKLNVPLFEHLPYAASFGPAYRQIAETYTFDGIQAAYERSKAGKADPEQSLGKAVAVIDGVYAQYSDMSGGALCRMARSQAPWRKARKRAQAPEGAECNEIISLKSMKKFFSKAK
ncbi:MAG: hypothetical protein IJ111_14950 [Eggerthellaceae bacterium]|nr:hypothetical protein [Eggerthellaceae bacterium]